MSWFFNKYNKKEIELVKEEVKNSFFNVKEDMNKISQWVTHLHTKDISREGDLFQVKIDLSTIKQEINELKELLSILTQNDSGRVFKTPSYNKRKQTIVGAVQTPVQTVNFYGISNLSITEKAIIWLLVNSELKLSYEDIAAMLGKTKSTIRGQINSIKQKSDGLIEEAIEMNGKKRVYMPEEIKEKILKRTKVSVQKVKKGKN